VQRLANAATLVGMEVPPPSRNIELKPYGVSNLTTNRVASPPTSNKIDKDIGIDAKYGITSNMTLDLTVNTDFAQVEIDEQQVNLTRFSLFFPEKRDFFLEGQGIFDFANTGNNGFRQPDVPIMFFSRRIGLDAGQPVPIKAGRAVDGACGQDLPRPARDSNRRRRIRPFAWATAESRNQLSGRTRQARHLAAKQHRHHRHSTSAAYWRLGFERAAWHGHDLELFRERAGRDLLRAVGYARTDRATTAATAATSVTYTIATAWKPSG
jgi:hypothetical protein